MDALARHRMLALVGVPLLPPVEYRAEPEVEDDEDLDEEEFDDELDDEDAEDDDESDEDEDDLEDESEDDSEEVAPEGPSAEAQARHRMLELLGIEVRSALHPASNPAPGRQVITQAGSHRFKLPIGATILADGMVLFQGRKMSRHEATQIYHQQHPDGAPAKPVKAAAGAAKAARPSAPVKAAKKAAPAKPTASRAARAAVAKFARVRVGDRLVYRDGDLSAHGSVTRRIDAHEDPETFESTVPTVAVQWDGGLEQQLRPDDFQNIEIETRPAKKAAAPRMSEGDRKKLADRLGERYDNGESLSQIAKSEKMSTTAVHDLLVHHGHQLRPRGGVKKAAPTKAAKKAAPSYSRPGKPVDGRDLLTGADDSTLARQIIDESHSYDHSADAGLSAIAHEQGFDGLPKVVDAQEMDRLYGAGGVRMTRGIHAGSKRNVAPPGERRKTAVEIQDQLREGPAYFGNGNAGSGYTFAVGDYHGQVPVEYSDGTPGSIVRATLAPDAKIASLAELRAEYDRITKAEGWTGFRPRVGWMNPSDDEGMPDAVRVFGDPGRLAAALGYDAYWVTPDHEIVVVNRTKLIVEERPADAPAPRGAAKAAKKAATSAPSPFQAARKAGLSEADANAYADYVRDHPGASVQQWRAARRAPGAKSFDAQSVAERLRAVRSLDEAHAALAGLNKTQLRKVAAHKGLRISPSYSRDDTENELVHIMVGGRLNSEALQRLVGSQGAPTVGTAPTVGQRVRLNNGELGTIRGLPTRVTAEVELDNGSTVIVGLSRLSATRAAPAPSPHEIRETPVAPLRTGDPQFGRYGAGPLASGAVPTPAKPASRTRRPNRDAGLDAEERLAGQDVTPGHDQLHHYWTRGEGLAKWADSPKPWTTLVAHLTKYVGPEKAKRFASQWVFEVFGLHTGNDLYRVEHGGKPRGHRIGPG